MATTQIAILGAGPAGSATALALRELRPDAEIHLIEADDYRAVRVGETLHPIARVLLQRLGVWDSFLAEQHAEAHGSVAVWGSEQPGGNDFFTWRFGTGFHLDRQRFDSWLATAAEQRGVRRLRQTRWRAADYRQGRWQLQCDGPQGRQAIKADFVVDATGRRAIFARRVGARPVLYDRLVGAFLFFDDLRHGLGDSRTWIEATAHGWWYAAPLPNRRIAVACMTDHDLARKLSLARRDGWLTALDETRHLADKLSIPAPEASPKLYPAQAGRLDHCAGPGWLAVGDAAAHFDPLSGQGLTQALRGAIAAAHAIADSLAGREDALARYQALIGAEVNAFLNARDHFYGQEQRWPDALFWQRRQQRITLDPTLILEAAPTAAHRHDSPLSQGQWQKLMAFCQLPQPAHAIVAALLNDTGLPARHLVLALQQALETGDVLPVTAAFSPPSLEEVL